LLSPIHMKPNARRQARGAAAARHKRRLFPVACTPKLDGGLGPQTL
jgi:hypothetical protein